MPKKEKCIDSRIKKMKEYIKDSRVKKLKKLYKTFQESNLEHVFMKEINSQHGKRQRTYLHKCCANGDSTVIRTLLDFKADFSSCDKNNNNILHYALNYMLQSCDQVFFETTVLYLLSISSQTMMEKVNNYGEIPEELLAEVMYLINNKQTTFLLDSDDETEFDEKDWNEKLFYEMASEDRFGNENYAQDEIDDTFKKSKEEDHYEWGERIRKEYHAKKNPKKVETPDAASTEVEKEKKYGPTLVDELRKKLEMFALRDRYEKSCKAVFSADAGLLGFKDIPWPVTLNFDETIENLEEILESIVELLSYGFSDEDKLKYLKKQQVRWHPDRFLQKCGDRLHNDDKDNILQIVNHLSQRINAAVDSLS